jgi:hypothetical protein
LLSEGCLDRLLSAPLHLRAFLLSSNFRLRAVLLDHSRGLVPPLALYGTAWLTLFERNVDLVLAPLFFSIT